MLARLPSKLKLPIAVFVLSFLFFLLYTVLDDIILKSPMGQNKAVSLSIRLALSVSFSLLLSSLVFYSVKLIYASMRGLVTLVQDWGSDVYEETPVAERDDEIGELVRAFRIKFFQQKELEGNDSQEVSEARSRELSDGIQRSFYRIQLPKIRNVDISLFPRMSSESNCDYVNVIPTGDGCAGVLAGFSSPGILESAFKARLEGIFSLAAETPSVRGEELIFKIGKTLSKMPVPFLNLSLFYLETRTGELGYVCFQELSPFLFRNDEVIVLEKKSKAKFFDYKPGELNLQKTTLRLGEILLLTSDRTFSAIGIPSGEFVKQFQNALNGKKYPNSRDVILDCGRVIERRYGKNVLDTSALLAVGRKY
ncbi:Arg-Lys translocation region protein phosphatase [Leptospira ellisii]|uniref:Arg-Lys translocation region protein phosphatase n=1 Tax=Leptospira ellisii TaxID=2023197 RepID=A0AAE4TWT5_9LEPT|nr:Arg-Lys translocation region protein phosphatase RktP [Leptospira ellisii]MDV6234859.1 Arg-Lys translocation region protein phosphatase [Leptospira ellisii]PKA02946.1 Arg-Lys translocation region protein phosphatase [Leptospira ellisii]